MQNNSIEEIRQLEILFEDGVIDSDEFNNKVIQICKSENEDPVGMISESNTGEQKPKKGKNTAVTILSVLLVILIGTSGYLGYQYYSQSTEIAALEKQNEEINAKNDKLTKEKKSMVSKEKYQEQVDKVNELLGYKHAVIGFYLDGTVIVFEGDNTYYHRYNCPRIPSRYTYWAYNPEAAIDRGFTKCPVCFNYSVVDYCKRYIEE